MSRCHLLLSLLMLVWAASANASENLAEFVEAELHRHLASEEYPSGVLTLVSENEVLLRRGFGISNLEAAMAFDPAKSLVYTASVSKIITATAVLQLFEDKRLCLDDPVGRILGIPPSWHQWPEDVTVRHLLTHTGGLSDQSIGFSVKQSGPIPELQDTVKKHLPPVVWEPGRFRNYSNFGFVLLAAVVEKVSGQRYEDYVRDNIFTPLNMNRSRIGADFSNPRLMKPYKWKADDDVSPIYLDLKDQSYTKLIGASGFITTADDMGRFIQAHLKTTSQGGRSLIAPATKSLAWGRQFSYDERLPHHQGLGWLIKEQNGLRQIYHMGDGSGIETALVMWPDKGVGLFLSMNNDADFKYPLVDAISTFLHPKYAEVPEPTSGIAIDPGVNGTYRYMNLSQHTFEKVVYLFGISTTEVAASEEGLKIGSAHYAALEENLFKHDKSFSYAHFLKDAKDSIRYLTFGYSTYIKLKMWESPRLHQVFLGAGVLTFLLLLAAILIRQPPIGRRLERIALPINGLMIPLAFVVLMFIKDGLSIDYGPPWQLWPLFTLPLLAVAMFPLTMLFTLRVISGDGSRALRTAYGVGIVLLAIQLLIASYYRLIGFHFG